jgi:cytidylate kinase
VAELVAEKLNLAYFDKQIIDHIADQAHIDSRIVEALDEHMRSSIETWVEGILTARHFDRSEYVAHLLRVIKTLATRGGCVILGRGANFILQNQPNSYHFCITSPIENRIQEVAKREGVDPLEAGRIVRSIDSERRALLQRMFHHRPDDPDYYHAMFNSSRIGLNTIVEHIVQIVNAEYKV